MTAVAGAGVPVVISMTNIVKVVIGVSSGAVGVRIKRDGSIQIAENALGTSLSGLYVDIAQTAEWRTPKGESVGDAYVISAAMNSGTLSFGTIGEQSLGADRDFTLVSTTVGSTEASVQLTFKRNGVVLASASVTFQIYISGV